MFWLGIAIQQCLVIWSALIWMSPHTHHPSSAPPHSTPAQGTTISLLCSALFLLILFFATPPCFPAIKPYSPFLNTTSPLATVFLQSHYQSLLPHTHTPLPPLCILPEQLIPEKDPITYQ